MNNKKKSKKVLIIISTISFCALFSLLFLVISLVSSDKTFDITALSIKVDGSQVETVEKDFLADDFSFSLSVNNDREYFFKNAPIIEWSIISEDTLNCQIDNAGKFTVGDTLGQIIVQATATSKNKLSANVTVNIIANNTYSLDSIEAIIPQTGLTFIEGQTFDTNGIQLLAHFNNIETAPKLTEFSYSNEPLTLSSTEFEIKFTHAGVERIATLPIVILPKVLQSIEVTKTPNTLYTEGQTFDNTDLEVTAHYEYINEIITDYTIINGNIALTPTTESLTITYTKFSVTKTVNLTLIVSPRTLQSIEIQEQPTKIQYIQGQFFDKSGLKVTAHYEYMDLDITNVVTYNTNKLMSSDQIITLMYSENNISFSQDISITVLPPYQAVRKITFENPYDATLSWSYIYTDDSAQEQIDNTSISEHTNLLFDSENGIYIAPVGAVITIMRINPAITDFVIDGVSSGLQNPASSINFELESGDDINITFNKVLGDRITLRFAGGANQNNWAFIYPLNYNSTMRTSDLSQISQIYEDTSTYYYEFNVNETTYTFAELSQFIITANTLISVTKITREATQTINISVVYPNDVHMAVVLDTENENAFYNLPRIEKTGYTLDFVNDENEVYTLSTFNTWLETAQDDDIIYTIYTLNANEVSGDIVGTWNYEIINENVTVTLVITFNSNATYNYKVQINGEDNCEFFGIYEYTDGAVIISSCESNMEYQLVCANDFEISLTENILSSTLFIIDGLNVGSTQVELEQL